MEIFALVLCLLGGLASGIGLMAYFQKRNQKSLEDSFKALSSDALRANNESFLSLAKQQLESQHSQAKFDLEKRQESINHLVTPIRETLDKFGKRMQEIEKDRVGSYQSLIRQITTLSESEQKLRQETSNLVAALRAPQARGRWGEMQLKRVVEMAGMLEHCDFVQQSSQQSENGQLRPDMVVRLPADKKIVVDAKTPLASYLDAIDQRDPDKKNQLLADHARHVKRHIEQLSRKSYWDQFKPSPDFVVLFLPGEAFFGAALEQDPGLIEAGVQQNVIVATPTTLIALLRAVAFGWRQESLAEDAERIGALGRELYKRLSDMGSHFSRVGKSLETAVDSYNRTLSSLESRVMVTARKFDELKIKHPSADLNSLRPIEITTKKSQAPELQSPSPEN